MPLLHLVRHGQASAGSADYDRLSPLGEAQSRHLGRWWRERGFPVDAAFHGTLRRQRDTASIVMGAAALDLPVSVLPDLDEYDHRGVDRHVGDPTIGASAAPVNPEAMTYSDYASVMRGWRDSPGMPAPLESWADFSARGWRSILESANACPADARLAYFTSGGIVSTVLAAVLGLDFEHTIDAIWRVRNASITSIALDGEVARLVEFNNVAHLDVHREPGLVTLI